MLDPNFKVIEEKKEKDYGRFIIEPLEPGFGNTLGVGLRRVLLANIEGAAVTSVKIDNVRHMFATLPGLKEDIIELILNIKELRVRLVEDKKGGKLTLKKTGPGQITSDDLESDENVEVLSKGHYLGSLANSKSKIEIEMIVEQGYGYSLAEERRISTVGVIPIDAIFSPVLKVSYRVEQTRVGRQTNYDKLILEIWTDGTIDPKDALERASKTLVAYFTQIYQPKADASDKQVTISSAISDEVLKMTIDELDLPTRIYNSLRNAGIETVGQLLGTPHKELMNFRNLGAKSLGVIEESLKAKGIPFNI